MDSKQILHKLIDFEYELSIKETFKNTFDFFIKNVGVFVIYTIISLALIGGISFLIPFGQFVLFFFLPAIMAGPTFFTLKNLDQDVEVKKQFNDLTIILPEKSLNQFFEAFKHTWQLLIISTISSALIGVGFFFLIIPGIYLMVAYSLYECVYYDFKLSFWETLEIGRKLIQKRWGKWFLLLIVSTLVGYGGIIFFGVGVLVTLPFSACLHVIAYHQLRQKLIGNIQLLESQNQVQSSTLSFN